MRSKLRLNEEKRDFVDEFLTHTRPRFAYLGFENKIKGESLRAYNIKRDKQTEPQAVQGSATINFGFYMEQCFFSIFSPSWSGFFFLSCEPSF